MPRRTPETLADYLVVAICPTLIGLLVGSLMFFLVEVFYHGEFKFRMEWVMAMFVLAIVGIARISMERGLAYASLFAWPLAGSVAVALSSFAPGSLPFSVPLMGLVWWAAHKLTWDCTLVDDTQDASGQGLLQQMGLEPSPESETSARAAGGTETIEPEAMSGGPQSALSWWQGLLEPDHRPHAHGMWVVYFSLAALPLFGFGGWFVPADGEVRSRVFWLLIIYVGCGLGLLLATSFLGLRRYLRQRRLEMPVEMTATWITLGVALIGLTLVVAAILPRTRREQSLRQVPAVIASAARSASRFAAGKEGTNDPAAKSPATTEAKEGQSTDRKGSAKQASGGKADKSREANSRGESKQENQPGQSSSSSEKGGASARGKSPDKSGGDKSSGGKSGDGKSAKGAGAGPQQKTAENAKRQETQEQQSSPPEKKEQSQDKKGSDNKPGDRQQANDQPPPTPPSSSNRSNLFQQLWQALTIGGKWLFYAILLAAGAVAAWIYRDELLAAWNKLLEELRELWEKWFGKAKTYETLAAEATPPPPSRQSFAAFADPFATGQAARMSWPQLVRYSFQAVEAWGRERDCPRAVGQTPHEFAQALGAREPEIAAAVQSLAACYSQVAYAPGRASQGPTDTLRDLWHGLQRLVPPPLAARAPAGHYTS